MKDINWLRLDNSAKIYPMMVNRNSQNLYRLCIDLKEDVDKDILEEAVNMTLSRFPSIAVRMMSGMFWYYFEPNKARVKVNQETDKLMAPITSRNCNGYCFRVLYYHKRISIEYYHVLCDGTGAVEFFKSVLYTYLSLKGYDIDSEGKVLTTNSPIVPEELEDSFVANYKPKKFKDLNVKDMAIAKEAYALQGVPFANKGIGLIHIDTDSNAIHKYCKEQGYTMTAFIAGLVMYSIYMAKKNSVQGKYICLFLPINLRKAYNSISLRNFSFFARAGVQVEGQELSLQDCINIVRESLAVGQKKEVLDDAISTTVRGEKIPLLRITPLSVKMFGYKLYLKLFAKVKKTCTLSNMGKVDFPESMRPYIEKFYFDINISPEVPFAVGISTTYDNLNITFNRGIQDTEVEKFFARSLAELGFKLTVSGNLWEVDNAL